MKKSLIGAVLALVASVGCSAADGTDGTEAAENVGTSQQDLDIGTAHFVPATIVPATPPTPNSGFALCPPDEVMLGNDLTNGTRLVCAPMAVKYPPAVMGNGFDGQSTNTYDGRVLGNTFTCDNSNSTRHGVAIGWNHTTKKLKCRQTFFTTSYSDAASAGTNGDLATPSHLTSPYFQFHNPAFGGGLNDELPQCQSGRAVTEMASKNIDYYDSQHHYQFTAFSAFYSCGK